MRKRDAERQFRASLRRERHTCWIDARWIDALGQERIDAICLEEAYELSKGSLGRAIERAAASPGTKGDTDG